MQSHQILYTIRRVGPSSEERVKGSFEKELTPVNQETSKQSQAHGKAQLLPTVIHLLALNPEARELEPRWASFGHPFPHSTPQGCDDLRAGFHLSQDGLSCPTLFRSLAASASSPW